MSAYQSRRGIWSGNALQLTGSELVAAEIKEAFEPVVTWRRLAPVERTHEQYADVTNIPLTLVYWGWELRLSQGQGNWSISASKSMGQGVSIRAQAAGPDFTEALASLGTALRKEFAKQQAAAIRTTGSPQLRLVASKEKAA
jgi:hypothetical protein